MHPCNFQLAGTTNCRLYKVEGDSINVFSIIIVLLCTSGSALWLVFSTPTSSTMFSLCQMVPQCVHPPDGNHYKGSLSLSLSLSGFCRPIALHMYTCMYTLIVFFILVVTCVCMYVSLREFIGMLCLGNPSNLCYFIL